MIYSNWPSHEPGPNPTEGYSDELRQSPVVAREPQWKVDVGQGCEVGVAIDDGCYLVLLPSEVGQWRPTTYIPRAVALFLGQLASRYKADPTF